MFIQGTELAFVKSVYQQDCLIFYNLPIYLSILVIPDIHAHLQLSLREVYLRLGLQASLKPIPSIHPKTLIPPTSRT